MIMTAAENLQREFNYSDHQHESNGDYEHVIEANQRQFWISRCKHCGIGLTRRSKPEKTKRRKNDAI
jgi:hypothetical protein